VPADGADRGLDVDGTVAADDEDWDEGKDEAWWELADREPAEPFGLFLEHLDLIDPRAARTSATDLDEPFDRLLAALEDGLDRPVAVVADPAIHSRRDGVAPDGVAEEHALDESMHDHSPTNHRSRTMPSGSIVTSTRSPGAG
jgi:hypothetical protein